jgi:serine/threonine protein kinase
MEPGTKLGRYEIADQLSAGGMGGVHLAQDSGLGRELLIKVLPAEFASDLERLARFEQEAHAAAALNHPHTRTTAKSKPRPHRKSSRIRYSGSVYAGAPTSRYSSTP